MVETPARHPGRPRDPRIDEALLRFASEAMLERGYLATTIAEVARRAGVGTPAIYRRWPNKTAMALDIFLESMGEDPLADTGSVKEDLTEFTRLRIRQWSTPLFHQVVLPLLLEVLTDKDVRDALSSSFMAYREPLIERIQGWVSTGKLRADTDPTRLLDLLMGTISIPLLFGQRLPDESAAESIVDQVLNGFLAGEAART